MNLFEAPFKKPLRIEKLSGFDAETLLVLTQLGLDAGETIEKLHAAPLNDPVGIKIGEQVFSLRSGVCRKIDVVLL